MRSDWRGVARGTQPKRSKSARGPPVCISSIAQQARPKSIYHCDEARPQLSSSSTLVVKTVSGNEFNSGCMSKYLLRLYFFDPFEIALGPGINQAEHQDRDEDEDLYKREAALPSLDPVAECRRYWKDKGDLDL